MNTNTPIDRGSDAMKGTKKILHAHIDSDLFDAFKHIAWYNRRTITAEIHLALESYVNSPNAAEARRAFEKSAHIADAAIDRGEQN